MSDTDVHSLAGAYALDALDNAERHEFEAHLAICADCATEVAELRETAARLAVLSSSTPPEALRARVLAAAAATRQEPPITGDHGAEDELGGARRRRVLLRFAAPVAAALLGVLALTVGAWGLQQRDRADELTARASLVTSVLTAPDATTSSADIGSGSAKLVSSGERGAAVLVTSGTAAPPDDRVYELWRIDAAGRAVPAGTAVPDSDGSMTVPVAGSLDGVTTIAVTVEPTGGSDQPTTTPIAAFPIA